MSNKVRLSLPTFQVETGSLSTDRLDKRHQQFNIEQQSIMQLLERMLNIGEDATMIWGGKARAKPEYIKVAQAE